jgi:hypothetical protein
MFEAIPNAKANLKAGATYAVYGPDDWIYYGQLAKDKSIGFFRLRTHGLADEGEVLRSTLMCRFVVSYPSVGRALRSGNWKYLGTFPMHEALVIAREAIQWPVGTLNVSVWRDGKEVAITTVDDAAIQRSEIMAAWDAVYHVPERLKVDHDGAEPGNTIGGPIWRERLLKQEFAKRFPDKPFHELPTGWVWLESTIEFAGSAY